MMKRFILLVGFLLVGLHAFGATFSFNFDGSGFISDGAAVIDESDKKKISFYADYVKAQTSYQILVVTLDSLEGVPASKVAKFVSEHGAEGSADNILVFLVSPNEGKIGVEIGENLKSDISYVALKNIIQEEISPSFKKGEYSSAITRGIYYISRIIEPSLSFVRQDYSGQKLEQMSQPMPKTAKLPKEYVISICFVAFGLLLLLLKLFIKKPAKSRRGGFGNYFGI